MKLWILKLRSAVTSCPINGVIWDKVKKVRNGEGRLAGENVVIVKVMVL